ncbi:MAG: AraC family transcriptional regulator [Polyangiaceae bacterium]
MNSTPRVGSNASTLHESSPAIEASRSAPLDALFRGSSLSGVSSLELGWSSLTLERRLVMSGERVEEVMDHHFIALWEHETALGERADIRGRFAPYVKHPGALSMGPPGLLPAVRARNESWVVACAIEPGFAQGVDAELDTRPTSAPHELLGFEDQGLQALLRLLVAEVEVKGCHGRLYADSLLHALTVRFLHLARAEQQRAVSRVSALPRGKLARILERMHADLSEDIDLASLARESGYSRAHFLRMFRAATGKPPHQYMLELRLEHARRRLTDDPSVSLTEVALASGFSSHAHLSTLFRRRFGVTPSQYRRSK